MRLFLDKNKRKIYHVKYLLLIIIIFLSLLFFIKNKYEFITGLELMNNGQVIVSSTNKASQANQVYQNLTLPQIPILSKKEVQVNKIDENEKNVIYNTFTISELIPYQTYNYNLMFRLEGINTGQVLTIGTQEIEPQSFFNQSKKIFENNIDLTTSKKMMMGLDNNFEIPLTMTADSEGNCYFYIGIDTGEEVYLDYKISNLKLEVL